MKRHIAMALCAALLLTACAANPAPAPQHAEQNAKQPAEQSEAQEMSASEAAETDEASETDAASADIWKTVEEAYVYALPLVLMDATKISATNTVTPEGGKAPVNQFIHMKTLANSQSKNVVSPNVDTIYTQVWYDLSEEPMIYVLPEAERFCKVQVLDAWTNTPAVLEEAGTYAITLSAWEGELPEGVTRIDVPTAMAWSITRTVLSGEEDIPYVRDIQSRMQLLPLSAYVDGGDYTAPEGKYSEDNEYVPINQVLTMDPVTFFSRANVLMEVNPPAAADGEILTRIAAVGVGPGMTFDPSVLTGDIKENWTAMLQQLRPNLLAKIQKFAVQMGTWNYFGAPIGNFGTEYDYRALVAIAGLGANPVEVALYPKAEVDADGNTLTGENTYRIHFETCPQVLDGGFWSVTAYGEDDFLIDNPLNRYCVNDRSGLLVNEDGSVDVILSKEAPEDTTNWLPVGEGGFHLYMRIYTPDTEALKTWTVPEIIRVN